MKDCKYIKNEVFINKSKMRKIILIITLFFCILKKVFSTDNSALNCIIYCYFILSSTIDLVLLRQIDKFYSKKLINLIHICFYGIIMMSIFGFILSRSVVELNVNYRFVNWNIIMSIIFCTNIMAVIINEYCFKINNVKKVKIISNILMIAMFIASYFLGKIEFVKILFVIIEIIIGVIIYRYILLNSLKDRNNLNMISYYFILIVFINVVSILDIIDFLYSFRKILDNIIQLVHIISFEVLANIVILNLVKEPYRQRQKIIEDNNEKLEEINAQILIKNRNLEESITNVSNKEEIYSTFFKYMPHPVIIINSENYRILFVNTKFLELINNKNAKDVINKKLSSFIECLDERNNEIYEAILKYANVTKFISIKYFEYDYTKKIMLIKDNTSKVEIEQIKKEIENKKNQENIRTQFLSSISHDLKTPINVIYSVSQLQKIYTEKHDIESLKKYNSICKTNCFNLIKLTNNLIDNSKIISDYLSPRLKRSNLVEIVEDNVMSLVEYVKWNNIELIFDTNTEECYVKIDEEFMQRIIINLISNAIKYNKENGRIEVIIYESQDEVSVSVKDNGIGMTEEFREKAFERYSSNIKDEKYMKKSSGLGLFVVKQLVELQNGRISIESEYNVGTNIIILFKKDKEYEE